MPRKPRLHVPGGFFHVILRGNGRSDIFFAREDRSIWESLIADAVRRYEHRIHAYCWMTNHTHMAIQSGPEPLAQFITYIAGNYARRMNIRMQRSGHLFERRYRALLVQEDTYLLELVRYIHMNPVRAGLVDCCGDYEWSSHSAYLDSGKPEWLTVDYVLRMFGKSGECAQRKYAEFISEPQEDSIQTLLRAGCKRDNRHIGSDDWLEKSKTVEPRVGARKSLDEIIVEHCRNHAVTEAELSSTSRSHKLAAIRAEIATDAVAAQSATITEIAKRFGRSQPTLSRTMRRLRIHRNKL